MSEIKRALSYLEFLKSQNNTPSIDIKLCTSIQALQEKLQREENKALTLEEFRNECELQRENKKIRWLWVMGDGWVRVDHLSKWSDINRYGKTWLAYRNEVESEDKPNE